MGGPVGFVDAQDGGDIGKKARLIDFIAADGSLGPAVPAAAERDISIRPEMEFAFAEEGQVGLEKKDDAADRDGRAGAFGVAEDRSDVLGGGLSERGRTPDGAAEDGFKEVDVHGDIDLFIVPVSAFQSQLHSENGRLSGAGKAGFFGKGAEDAERRGKSQGFGHSRDAEGQAVAVRDPGQLGGARIDIAGVAGCAAGDLEGPRTGKIVEVPGQTLGKLERRGDHARDPVVFLMVDDHEQIGASEPFLAAEVPVIGKSIPLRLDGGPKNALKFFFVHFILHSLVFLSGPV